ncbi:metallophosphoesterase [Marinobacterium weihaiense]|uniref:Metallophosphoesterase n=1 Tax=Marinobacterium weihaiense TaxID=2851016 RepID=A0ABS6MBH5_9GAMM|nr:metallophosphoesterase [Marinobacterium weihaiense]MBV0933595.1 metallophosphoesterase [Marinobacterium weihaiense]
MDVKGYDIIGDIHGHADELVKLLNHLGYQDHGTGFSHATRKVIFLGDFIDRGEHLRQHRQLLGIVMPMVSNGHAHAVMGNHEFNALAFHTEHDGEYLRPHTAKNIEQHQAFLNEYEAEPDLKREVLDFFIRLPLWLELDGIRVVHACWDDEFIKVMCSKAPKRVLDRDLLIEASMKGTLAYNAIERLLKGVEVKLPKGITFRDKNDHERGAVRVQWWKQNAETLGEIALPEALDIGHAASMSAPDFIPTYSADQPPCFVGHYWLDGEPEPLAPNVACLDYSVAKEGKLVAYRWSGERVLCKNNFTHI